MDAERLTAPSGPRLTLGRLVPTLLITLVLVVATLAVIVDRGGSPEARAEIPIGVAFDPDNLDPQPLWSAGVNNPPSDPNRPNSEPPLAAVFDFAEIGDRIYVGGLFPSVQLAWNGDPIAQPYLAAFDRDTGDWISSFRPSLNGGVYALDVSTTGRLLVGGDFTRVNGTDREALVALDPTSGAIDGTFQAQATRWFDEENPKAIVRGLELVGNDLYVMGNIDHIEIGANAYRIWSMARVRSDTGQIDGDFVPKVRYGVWDAAIDTGRGRVHVSGDFNSIDDDIRHAKMGTVSLSNGDPVSNGIVFHQPNNANQTQMPGIEIAADRIYVGGSEHVTHVKRASDLAEIGWNSWGVSCNNRNPTTCPAPIYPGGGDVQVIESTGQWILTGCHCWNRIGDVSQMHYSTFSGQRLDREYVGIYDAATSQISSFKPNLRDRQFGTWGIHVDANSCLYLGGDYTGAANGNWVGGFAKFCKPTPAPQVSGSADGQTVTLSWSQPDSSLPVEKYRIYRDGSFLGEVSGNTTSFSASSQPAGTATYEVRAIDTHGRKSPATTQVTVEEGGGGGGGGGNDDTVTRIRVRHSDKCMDVADASLDSGVKIQQWRCHSGDNQKWTISEVGGGYHTIRAVHSGKCLEVQDSSTANGAWVTQATCDGGTNQHFSFFELGDGWRQIRPRHSGKCLDVGGVSLENFARIQQWNCAFNANLNQDWTLTTPADEGGGGGGPDVTPPSTPTGVTATQISGTSVRLTWNPATDNVGVRGYLIHDNYQYQRWVPGATTIDMTGLAPGSTHRYQVRAQDAAGNNSEPSTRTDITLG